MEGSYFTTKLTHLIIFAFVMFSKASEEALASGYISRAPSIMGSTLIFLQGQFSNFLEVGSVVNPFLGGM